MKDLQGYYIGSSDIGALLGVDRWRGELDVWLRKTKRKPKQEATYAMKRGIIREEGTVRMYENETGLKVLKSEKLVSKLNPVCLAIPDGIVTREGKNVKVLEVKNPSWRTADHWGAGNTPQNKSDDIPLYYRPQVQWEMGSTQNEEGSMIAEADVAVDFGDDFRIYTIPFDPELFASLVEIAEKFIIDYLIPDKQPPLDHTDGAKEWITSRYPQAKGKDLIEADDSIKMHLADLASVKENIKFLEIDKKRFENTIKEVIGDHYGVKCDFGKAVFYNVRGKTSTDWKALSYHVAEMCDRVVTDEMIAAFTKEGNGYRAFKATFKDLK